MDALERFDAEYELSAQLYRAIGRFIVRFEWLCDAMRQQICSLVWDDPMTAPAPVYIVLGDTQPGGLLQRAQALLDLADFQDGDRPIVKSVFKRIDDLIQARNKVVHGLWLTDLPLPDGTVVHTKLRHSPRGLKRVHWQRTPEEIELLADEAEALALLLGQFSASLSEGEPMEPYAIWDDSGRVKIVW